MSSLNPLTPRKLLVGGVTLLALSLVLVIAFFEKIASARFYRRTNPNQYAESLCAAVISIEDTNTLAPSQRPLGCLPATPTPIPTPSPTPIPTAFHIKKISGHRQVYHLGCETSASVDWANFFWCNLL